MVGSRLTVDAIAWREPPWIDTPRVGSLRLRALSRNAGFVLGRTLGRQALSRQYLCRCRSVSDAPRFTSVILARPARFATPPPNIAGNPAWPRPPSIALEIIDEILMRLIVVLIS
jgi:hypothetical protein